jgi:hypothetical protein
MNTEIKHVIAGQTLIVNMEWSNCDGEGWRHVTQLDIDGRKDFSYDIKGSTPSVLEVKEGIKYLLDDMGVAVGYMELGAAATHVRSVIEEVALRTYPKCSASESYYGI